MIIIYLIFQSHLPLDECFAEISKCSRKAATTCFCVTKSQAFRIERNDKSKQRIGELKLDTSTLNGNVFGAFN